MVAAAGALEMTGGQRAELERLARSHTAPVREVRQAKALLWATDGVSNAEIARRCASTPKSVRRWRSRFAAEGTATSSEADELVIQRSPTGPLRCIANQASRGSSSSC